MNVKKEEIYSQKTGEVFYEKKSYVPEIFNEDGYYFWHKRSQSRQFTGVELPISSYEDKGIFCDMCRLFLSDNSNMLEVRNRKATRPFGLKDLAQMLNVSERQARRRMSTFLDSGVIAKLVVDISGEEEIWLVVNPLYFVAGKRINDTLYKLFRGDLDNYLSMHAKIEFARRNNWVKENKEANYLTDNTKINMDVLAENIALRINQHFESGKDFG